MKNMAQQGKRLEKPDKGTRMRTIVLAAALGTVGILAAAYLGLCIYVGASGTILPGTYVTQVDLGGMTTQQALLAVDSAVAQAHSGVRYTLRCGNSAEEVDGSLVASDSQSAVLQAWNEGRGEIFWKQGAVILAHLAGRQFHLPCEVRLSPEGEAALAEALDRLSARESAQLVETVWTVRDDALVIVKGVTGLTLDREEAAGQVRQAVGQGRSVTVECRLERQEPEPLDLQAVYDSLYVEPQDATVDPETYQALPHVVGQSFDLEQAIQQFEALPEGETLTIPLILTVPQITQEKLQSMLFADVLGECTTHIGGTANRLNNVALAAKYINGTVLMPGDVFSYNGVVGPRSAARGFLPAPAYVGGATVDQTGGGICQDSSTLYLAVLRSNLKIVERHNHMYKVSYMPAGMDATVAYGALDFQFENDTPYPLRVEARVEEREMIVVIHGTKTDDVTVKMTNKVLSTNPAETVYKEDSSVPRGSTVVDVTPYDGSRVEVYRNLYDGSGKLISSTLESTNRYNRRDKVILYNPADAVSLGLAPAEPSQGTVLPVNPPEEGETGAPQTPAGPDAPPSDPEPAGVPGTGGEPLVDFTVPGGGEGD